MENYPCKKTGATPYVGECPFLVVKNYGIQACHNINEWLSNTRKGWLEDIWIAERTNKYKAWVTDLPIYWSLVIVLSLGLKIPCTTCMATTRPHRLCQSMNLLGAPDIYDVNFVALVPSDTDLSFTLSRQQFPFRLSHC